jgi:hypothetical protein
MVAVINIVKEVLDEMSFIYIEMINCITLDMGG